MQGFYQKTSLNLSVVNYVLKLFRGFFYRALIRSRHDGHMYNLRSVFLTHKYHLYPVRFILNSLFKSMIYDSPDYSLRYVLFTLNYQPEHSIDVEAPFWTNQLDVISTIAKSLPADCHLFVKEHPNSLGLRSFSFYRKVRSLPNTRVLSYDCDIKALIQRSELVACITGTVALEANFMNVPSVTLGSTFMDRLSLVTSLRCPSQIASVINNPPERDEELDLRIIKELLDCSFKGSVSDVITDPSSLDRENLNDLEAAFFALVQSSCSY
jgi:hypothetical protein